MKNRAYTVVAATVFALLLGAPSLAQYDYGGAGSLYGGGGDDGFMILFEGGLANPRNTDNIVAAVGPNVVIPTWDDEFAGRIAFGYQWPNGARFLLSGWGFEIDQSDADSGNFNFPIGPTSGTSYDLTTELTARTIDAAVGVKHEMTDKFDLEWSVGLRFASYEETTDGTYDGTDDVSKSLESDMIGARLATRGSYDLGPLFANVGLGLAMLDGEIDARSSHPDFTPLLLVDDSRSGSMFDLDVNLGWRNSNEKIAVWLGWESQVWNGIVSDLARNLPGNDVIARSRDSVTFSWVKLGFSYHF